MLSHEKIFTTGQVATICHVAPRTVTKWFDSGKLKGYRIPGSRDRRIPANELYRFMKSNHMPTMDLDAGLVSILIIDTDCLFAKKLCDSLSQKGSYKVTTTDNLFDTGCQINEIKPNIVLMSLLARGFDCPRLCSQIHIASDMTNVIALAQSPSQSRIEQLQSQGFDEVVCDSGNISQIIAVIDHAISIF